MKSIFWPGKIAIINTTLSEEANHSINDLENCVSSLPVDYDTVNGRESGKLISEKKPSHIILSGVSKYDEYSLADDRTQEVIDRDYSWLKDISCPVLGICFGHQIIAHIYGGEISPMERPREGPLQLEMVGGLWGVKSVKVDVAHRDYVSKMPDGFKEVCAKGDVPYVISNPERRIYGLQFHPEHSMFDGIKLLAGFIFSSGEKNE